MEFIYPSAVKEFPVITYNVSPGDALLCPIIEAVVVKSGYAIATFQREMLSPDRQIEKAEASRYPAFNCGTIMAWGWGHSVVVDYLQTRMDTKELIATGHSRAGKAALCTGIFDSRFEIIGAMGSGCGGLGSARFLGTVDGKRQDDAHCETIGSLVHHFPHWFSKKYSDYGTRQEPYLLGKEVEYFPLDAHILRAACAPRAVFNSEGTDDFWANAFGTQLACDAAQKVYEFLGIPERNGFHIRPGGHSFGEHDWIAFIDFCDVTLKRKRLMAHDDTTMHIFSIDLKSYPPWT